MCTADKRLYNSNMSIKIEPPKLCSLVTSSSFPEAPQRKFQTVSRSWRILSFWWPSVSHLYCCLFPEWKFPCDFVICLQLYFNSVTLVKSLETLIQTAALTAKTQLCRQETEEDRGKKMSQIKDIQVFLFLLGWRPWTTEQKQEKQKSCAGVLERSWAHSSWPHATKAWAFGISSSATEIVLWNGVV